MHCTKVIAQFESGYPMTNRCISINPMQFYNLTFFEYSTNDPILLNYTVHKSMCVIYRVFRQFRYTLTKTFQHQMIPCI